MFATVLVALVARAYRHLAGRGVPLEAARRPRTARLQGARGTQGGEDGWLMRVCWCFLAAGLVWGAISGPGGDPVQVLSPAS